MSTRLLVTLTLIALALLALTHCCQAESFDSLVVGEVWGPGVVSDAYSLSPVHSLLVPRDTAIAASSLWWTAGERWYAWDGSVWVNPACSAVWVDDLETPELGGWVVFVMGLPCLLLVTMRRVRNFIVPHWWCDGGASDHNGRPLWASETFTWLGRSWRYRTRDFTPAELEYLNKG